MRTDLNYVIEFSLRLNALNLSHIFELAGIIMTLSKANMVAKGIGLYQITGAAIALGFCCNSLYNFQINLFWWLYLFLTIAFQLFFLIAGVKLFQLKSIGFAMVLYSQLFQLVSFYLLGFGYKNASGIGLFVGIDLSNTIELTWQFAFTTVGLGKAEFTLQVVYINLIPLLILYLLEQSKVSRETSANIVFAK